MKLRNKKTDEVIDFDSITDLCFGRKIQLQSTNIYNKPIYIYNSLAELNEEWEDVPEEPKDYWYLNCDGDVIRAVYKSDDLKRSLIAIGNYFETPEEAEKAVEKLKAWKRLKSGGFEFMSCSYGHDKTTDDTGGRIRFRVNHLYDDRYSCEVEKDLALLFGGEE